jgi:hypothetical protein
MPSQTTTPCPACGAPNEPQANLDYMSCTYCGTNLEIPKDLRKKAERRLAVKEKTMTHSAAEVDVSELLRQAQPIATGALNLLFIWNWAKRIIPVCLTMAIILFIACLLAGGLLFVFGGR